VFMNVKPHFRSCWIRGCAGSAAHPFATKTMFTDAIRLFPPSLQALAACGKHHRFDHEGFSAWFLSAICFVSRHDRFYHLYSVSVGHRSLCWVLQLYQPFPNQKANTTEVLLTIESPVEYIVRLTSVPPFPVICPGTIRS
jgi:hypothetical protein